jgi:YVTN family beta-propeller protein
MVIRMDHESSFVVTVSPAAVQMAVGRSVQLSAQVTTRSGRPISWDLSWRSPAADIATVTPDGLVTGVAAGDVVITADAGGVPDSIRVRVTAAGTGPSGSLAYVAEDDGVRVVDISSGYVVGSLIDVGGTPGDVAASPDARWIYVTRWATNDVVAIDRATHTTVGSAIGVGNGPRSIAVGPDGARAYVTSSESDELSVIDLSSNTLMKSIATRQGIAMTPDGTRVYVALLFSGSVSAIDTGTWAQIGSPIGVGRLPGEIAITPDGTLAYVTNTESGSVSVIDVATNGVVETIPIGCGAADLAITPDGTTVVVTCPNAHVLVRIDVTANSVVGDPIRLGRLPLSLAITP